MCCHNSDGNKSRILDSKLAAGGCTLTIAEPPQLQSAGDEVWRERSGKI